MATENTRSNKTPKILGWDKVSPVSGKMHLFYLTVKARPDGSEVDRAQTFCDNYGYDSWLNTSFNNQPLPEEKCKLCILRFKEYQKALAML